MQASVLTDDRTAVDAHDFAVRVGQSYHAHGLLVEVGLVVGRHQHGTVDDQIVGIGGRQSVAVVVDGAGQR